ncbi:MAG TPA: F0F1 ATP synthase subunit delta [Solirubrobacterales bacterium]|nr:F0F1 ATP synthase subunit delta [Solirubrobacterales bacterium]
MQEVARVYAEALFESARKGGRLGQVHAELAQLDEALTASEDLRLFLFSPYFSSAEKGEGLRKAVAGASPETTNFLDLLAEKHRLPILSRVRRELDQLWEAENRRIAVTVTSAIDLDPAVISRVGEAIEAQTGQQVELSSEVDAEILGGIVLQVGNMVLDASIRNRLEKLKKNVAVAA